MSRRAGFPDARLRALGVAAVFVWPSLTASRSAPPWASYARCAAFQVRADLQQAPSFALKGLENARRLLDRDRRWLPPSVPVTELLE
jgi:hypothetical protein